MSPRWLAAAFVLSLAAPVGERLAPGLVEARGSLAALALLPWLALATVPRGPPGASAPRHGSAWRAAAFAGCLALPPVLLGAGLDLARGADLRALAPACAGAWVALVLWCGAAESAVRAPRARVVFAALWLALLPGAAALRVALAWVPLRGGAEPPAGTFFALDPLVWCHRWGRAGGLDARAPAELGLALAGALLVTAAVSALAPERAP